MVAKVGRIGLVAVLALIMCMALVARTFGQGVQSVTSSQAPKTTRVAVNTQASPGNQPVIQLSSVRLDSYQQSSQTERYCRLWRHRVVCFGGENHNYHEGDHDGGDHDGGDHDGGDGGD